MYPHAEQVPGDAVEDGLVGSESWTGSAISCNPQLSQLIACSLTIFWQSGHVRMARQFE
jgi:hypothetical protein